MTQLIIYSFKTKTLYNVSFLTYIDAELNQTINQLKERYVQKMKTTASLLGGF